MSCLVYAELIVGITASLCDSVSVKSSEARPGRQALQLRCFKALLEATSRSQLVSLLLVQRSSAASIAASSGLSDVKRRNIGCVKAGGEADARVKRCKLSCLQYKLFKGQAPEAGAASTRPS
ncbi:uncharacterized protein B0H18DRAFT_1054946 [Fomitopsis serialis]|uniref:uncharacterized protein n=1 Tax=Fomitopsis serialis TaxID=139415 RepID=UPI0020083084|nr:uncharacterized protein B0H18DRAFT_1054946 [Neoantrodia serialis]KAH9912280.1 hypothetical protein B0H18DRAFT_1054946 [Neoantrodia serialis]